MRETFNPETDAPRDRTQDEIQERYERIKERGGHEQLWRLESDDFGQNEKASLARKIEADQLSEPTLEERVETSLDDASHLDGDEQDEVRGMLARAETVEHAGAEEYADELREEALARAKYGDPTPRTDALDDLERAKVADRVSRAERMAAIDGDYASELRDEARETVAEAVERVHEEHRGASGDDLAIERDVEATVEALEIDPTAPDVAERLEELEEQHIEQEGAAPESEADEATELSYAPLSETASIRATLSGSDFDDDADVWRFHGTVVENGETTAGRNGPKHWPAGALKKAVGQLAGKPVVDGHSYDDEGRPTNDATVGKVTADWYDADMGWRYEMEVGDAELARKLHNGHLEVSFHGGGQKAGETDDGAAIMSDVAGYDLAIVPYGGARANDVEPGAAPNAAAAMEASCQRQAFVELMDSGGSGEEGR